MSGDLERLRALYERWNAGDLRAGAEMLDPDVVSRWPPEFPTGGTYHGLEGHRRAMREWLSAWDGLELRAEELIEIGDRIVVPFHVRARGKGSGAEVERRWVHVWTFRDGKAVMFEVFLNKEAALRTLGGN